MVFFGASMIYVFDRQTGDSSAFDPGGSQSYLVSFTADGRFLTVAALEQKFWRRLCELTGLPQLESRQFESRLPELEQAVRARPLADWLELFDGEDVCTGPVATHAEAAEFSEPTHGRAPAVGEHTDAWRTELAS